MERRSPVLLQTSIKIELKTIRFFLSSFFAYKEITKKQGWRKMGAAKKETNDLVCGSC